MIIIFNRETRQINQVVWGDQLPGGVEPGSDEKCLVVDSDIDEHMLHKCLIRLDETEKLVEILAPIRASVVANKAESRLNVPILQDAHYFEVNADGVDELVFHVEMDEESLPAWVNEGLQQQNIRVWQAVDGVGEESNVPASSLKDYVVNLKSAEPKNWIFCFDNWMIEPVTILVRARQP